MVTFVVIIFGPGVILGVLLGRASEGRVVRFALYALGGTAVWGALVWIMMFLFWPAPDVGATAAELAEAIPRLIAIAAVNAGPPFAVGWLLRRRPA